MAEHKAWRHPHPRNGGFSDELRMHEMFLARGRFLTVMMFLQVIGGIAIRVFRHYTSFR